MWLRRTGGSEAAAGREAWILFTSLRSYVEEKTKLFKWVPELSLTQLVLQLDQVSVWDVIIRSDL